MWKSVLTRLVTTAVGMAIIIFVFSGIGLVKSEKEVQGLICVGVIVFAANVMMDYVKFRKK